ncbi:hypothetical protein JW592_23590 [Streptomyces sp. DW4-2]|uniref:DUF1275 domain-containing protein n=1 Tax=Streptomyces spirodelae TaxID=2812904 RepID=A0ABS3WZ69_9ACTN|nr:hypothetical protein [Streptomyces spirodelae]
MGSWDPLYRVRVSSSGLIYAVIVGAWAAYLVPMWLRRQDELNEARPTERFSTAIRLLSGKAGMERRYAREAERRRAREGWAADDPYARRAAAESGLPAEYGYDDAAYGSDPDAVTEQAVDVRAFADPKTMVGAPGSEARTEVHAHRGPAAHDDPEAAEGREEAADRPGQAPSAQDRPRAGQDDGSAAAGARLEEARGQTAEARSAAQEGRRAKQAKRAKLLARRRRTTMMLFLAFTVGTVVAAVRGLALLWVPAIPAVLLSTYIVYLRAQERRRFAFTMDRRQAEAAARNLHAQRPRGGAKGTAGRRRGAAQDVDTEPGLAAGPPQGASDEGRRPRAGAVARTAPPEREPDGAGAEAHGEDRTDARQGARARAEQQEAAERRALVEQTDHAEWVDQQRARDSDSSEGEGWDPVPVPLPTYVSAPVAPRATRGVDLEAPDAWSSARSSTAPVAEPHPPEAEPHDGGAAHQRRDRTPLFDQYEDEHRPRAANE